MQEPIKPGACRKAGSKNKAPLRSARSSPSAACCARKRQGASRGRSRLLENTHGHCPRIARPAARKKRTRTIEGQACTWAAGRSGKPKWQASTTSGFWGRRRRCRGLAMRLNITGPGDFGEDSAGFSAGYGSARTDLGPMGPADHHERTRLVTIGPGIHLPGAAIRPRHHDLVGRGLTHGRCQRTREWPNGKGRDHENR